MTLTRLAVACAFFVLASFAFAETTTQQVLGNPVAELTSNGSAVLVSWSYSSSDQVKFNISRNDGSGTWIFLDSVDVGTLRFIDQDLSGIQSVSYKISACNSASCSTPIQTAVLTLPTIGTNTTSTASAGSPPPPPTPPATTPPATAPTTSQISTTPPPSTSPPTTSNEARVVLFVNGQTSIVLSDDWYTISWGAQYVKDCKLVADFYSGSFTDDIEINATGSRKNNQPGTYTLTCHTFDGQTISKKVTIFPRTNTATSQSTVAPPPLAPPPPPTVSTRTTSVIQTLPTVPDYYATLREIQTASQNTDPVSPVIQTTGAEPNEPSPKTVIQEIRTDAQVQDSGQKLEQLGRDVRRFEQTVAREVTPETPRNLNPTIAVPGITDAPRVIESLEALQERGGLGLYTDTDRDGVSDYDELHLYGTDPRNAYTAGDVLSDGERVSRGLDARTISNERVPVESPREAGQVSQTIFEVTAIRTVAVQDPSEVSSGVSPNTPVRATSTIATSSSLAREEKKLVFEGRALPNSFVTLYIFSTPVVVTVKTDDAGNWKYTLDTQLEDGSHELFVAMVNNDGRIVAKSPPVPFIKQAEAVEFIPLTTPPVTEVTLIDTLRNNLLVIGAFLLLAFAAVAVGFVGLRRTDTPAL